MKIEERIMLYIENLIEEVEEEINLPDIYNNNEQRSLAKIDAYDTILKYIESIVD